MFEIGQRARITAEFRDESGVLTNPTTVTAKLRSPAGVVSSPSVTPVSTGVYKLEVVPSVSGEYRVRITGSGLVDTSQVLRFVVATDEVGT